jgi:hypothetical protein
MFTHYRLKTGGLCYKVLAFSASRYDDVGPTSRSGIFAEIFQHRYVIIQQHNGNSYIIPEKEFWDKWEGVEPDVLPMAYQEEAAQINYLRDNPFHGSYQTEANDDKKTL